MAVWEEPIGLGVVVVPPERELAERPEVLDRMVVGVVADPKASPLPVAPVVQAVRILFGPAGYPVLVFLSVLLGLVAEEVEEEHLPEQVMAASEAPAALTVAAAAAAVLPRVQELLVQAVTAPMAF